MTETRIRFAADLTAPQQARRHLAEWVPAAPVDVLDDAVLIASELVANSVQHGALGFVTLHASMSLDCLRIAVHDFGAELPPTSQPSPDPRATRGRGLLLVAALASRWGVTPDDPPPGKTVWAEVDFG